MAVMQMVSYSLEEAKRKLAPVDSPYNWDEQDENRPPHVNPEEH